MLRMLYVPIQIYHDRFAHVEDRRVECIPWVPKEENIARGWYTCRPATVQVKRIEIVHMWQVRTGLNFDPWQQQE